MENTILALLKAHVANANMWRDPWVAHSDISALHNYSFALGKVNAMIRLCNELKLDIPVKLRDSIAQFELDHEEGLTKRTRR